MMGHQINNETFNQVSNSKCQQHSLYYTMARNYIDFCYNQQTTKEAKGIQSDKQPVVIVHFDEENGMWVHLVSTFNLMASLFAVPVWR